MLIQWQALCELFLAPFSHKWTLLLLCLKLSNLTVCYVWCVVCTVFTVLHEVRAHCFPFLMRWIAPNTQSNPEHTVGGCLIILPDKYYKSLTATVKSDRIEYKNKKQDQKQESKQRRSICPACFCWGRFCPSSFGNVLSVSSCGFIWIHTHTHTHTWNIYILRERERTRCGISLTDIVRLYKIMLYIYIYIYIYIYLYICITLYYCEGGCVCVICLLLFIYGGGGGGGEDTFG